MAAGTGFTEAVRQELAGRPIGDEPEAHAELAGLVRVAGTLTVHGGGGGLGLEVTSASGAVARRAYLLIQRRYGLRPELVVRAPGGVRHRTSYGVRIGAGAERVATDLAVLDDAGRPRDGLPADLEGRLAVAYLRGALAGGGSVSAPGRDPHLEIVAGSPAVARGLAGVIGHVTGVPAGVVEGARPRVVVKSGERIGLLLLSVGATRAFLAWDDRRLRRQLRGEANRLANADAANLRRTVEAAAAQVRSVEVVVAELGWEALDDDLRAIALARLANPTASLAELGALVSPPVGKSAVHRRIRRLEAIAAEVAERDGGPAGGGEPRPPER